MRNADNLLPAASVPVLPRLLLEKRARRFSPKRVIAAPGAPSGETRGDPGDEPEEDFFLPLFCIEVTMFPPIDHWPSCCAMASRLPASAYFQVASDVLQLSARQPPGVRHESP